MTEQTISVKEAVQLRLSAQLATDPNLREQLEKDSDAVIKPIIAELVGDDGEIDMSQVSTTVHIESGNDLHFVVAPEAIETDEVGGFAASAPTVSGSLGLEVSLGSVGGTDMGIKKRTEGGRCTNDGHRGTKCCYL